MGRGWSDIARDDRASVIPNGEDYSDGTAALLAPLVNRTNQIVWATKAVGNSLASVETCGRMLAELCASFRWWLWRY